MKLDERIQHHAAELRSAYAHRAPEPPTPRRRHTGLAVAVGAAAVAIAVIAPVALLTNWGEEATPGSVPAATSTPPPAFEDGAALAPRPVVDLPEAAAPGLVTQDGDSAFFAAGSRAFESDDLGGTWKETDPLPAGDLIGRLAASDEHVLAIGAHDGATSRVYISDDPWDGWDLVELPVPGDVVAVVPHRVETSAGGYAVAGSVTRSTFDDDVQVYLWRSTDGVQWSSTLVADMRNDFAFVDAILDGPDGVIVLTQTSSGRLIAFTEAASGWLREELRPLVTAEAAIGRTLTNTLLVDARVEGGEVFVWYAFRDSLGAQGMLQGALVRYTPDLGWEAKPLFGAIPRAMVRSGDGYVGIRFPDPANVPGLGSSIVVSGDGLTWREVASFANVDFTSLVAGRELEYFVAGGRTERDETTGRGIPAGAGLWRLTLAATPSSLANAGEPGG